MDQSAAHTTPSTAPAKGVNSAQAVFIEDLPTAAVRLFSSIQCKITLILTPRDKLVLSALMLAAEKHRSIPFALVCAFRQPLYPTRVAESFFDRLVLV